MAIKKTSIIILAYKEPEKFKKMLETLLKHTHQKKTPFEIVIVNNSDLPEFQFKNHSPLSFIDKMQRKSFEKETNCSIYECGGINLGTSKGFNQGAELSTGHYLCFFNSDYYMIDNWLESMIDCFEHKPKIGLVSCSTNVSGNIDERQMKMDYKESECAIAQMFTTKKIWKEVDGFNEDLFPVEFEDLDFSERIKEKGYRIFVNRKTFGYHDHDNSKFNDRKISRIKNRTIFRNKWGNKYPWA